jgi:hypothetical protein
MNPIVITIVVIFCTVCGTHLGMRIRKLLPDHHLTEDTKEIVKLGAGMIATLTALVLGLLISSAKDTLDTMNRELVQDGAKVILLDRNLANYGPATNEIRTELRSHVAYILKLLWHEDTPANKALQSAEDSHALERIQARLRDLSPQNDAQRQLLSQTLQLSNDLAMSRWLIVETTQRELPRPFLVVLLLWLVILYTCYGLIAPKNWTVRVVLFISALSVAGAIFLILEMNTPLGGIIKVSSAPLHKALTLLGR